MNIVRTFTVTAHVSRTTPRPLARIVKMQISAFTAEGAVYGARVRLADRGYLTTYATAC